MRVPSVHLNGTSKLALMADLSVAIEHIEQAVDAVSAACPNGRDYYPQGEQALAEALEEHKSRVDRLRSVGAELREIQQKIDEQGGR